MRGHIEAQKRYRAAHRDEIDVRQLTAYHARKITGTLATTEAPDAIESVAAWCRNLRESYLLALLERDAVIWKSIFARVLEHRHGERRG